jgi:DNA-directed RNA polymerase specialized sigma subunit
MPKKNNFYINNNELQKNLISYFDDKNETASKYIGTSLMLIAKKILNKPCFINYSPDRKDDMISDATFFMVKYMKRYDPNRGNPFAFFSQICFNAFIMGIKKQKKKDNMFVSLDYIENLGQDNNSRE